MPEHHQAPGGNGQFAPLKGLELITGDTVSEARGWAQGVREEEEGTLALLAAGFFRGGKGGLAVPYARTDA